MLLRIGASVLALCGLLSEIPFDLAIGGQLIDPGYQNVLWTFCIAAAALWAMEALRRLQIPLPLAALCAGAAGYLLGEALQSDYFGPGVLTVLVFALCRQWHIGRLPELAAMLVINGWLLPSAVSIAVIYCCGTCSSSATAPHTPPAQVAWLFRTALAARPKPS